MKQHSLLDKIQTCLLGMCFAGITFCANQLWTLNAFQSKQEEVNIRHDSSITSLTIGLSEQQKEDQALSRQVAAIEAVLPEWFKKGYK